MPRSQGGAAVAAKPEYGLVVRRYPPEKCPRGRFVTVWLSKKVSWGWVALISGDVPENVLPEVVEALGLPTVEDPSPGMSQNTPTDKPDCLPLSEPRELFP
jgi:hypothetical protein